MNTELTLSALVSMTPAGFEQFRSDGWFPRRALTDAVMRELLLPEGWDVRPRGLK